MKPLIRILACTILIIATNSIDIYAQNLLDLQGWTIGQGSSGIFEQKGMSSENNREWGEGPQGKHVILWKASPDGNADGDGGWDTHFTVDHTNMYRVTVWLKKTNSTDGNSYLGCNSALNLDGTVNDNPYFWVGDLPELNKWYLLVGYIHGSGDASTVNYGGIYDGVNGAKVLDMADFKFAIGTTLANHRSYLYYDVNVNDRQYFYAPRVDMVNGNEPSITSLLGIQSSSSDQTYFSGKVGIKTTNPGDYDLAVSGKIRSKEVKVELAGWSDFVFAKDYQLPTLQETEEHIKEKGHLSGIPSAKEVKANGVELGDMNAKLLQKIEELTLYLIDKDKQVKNLQEEMNQLKRQVTDNLVLDKN